METPGADKVRYTVLSNACGSYCTCRGPSFVRVPPNALGVWVLRRRPLGPAARVA